MLSECVCVCTHDENDRGTGTRTVLVLFFKGLPVLVLLFRSVCRNFGHFYDSLKSYTYVHIYIYTRTCRARVQRCVEGLANSERYTRTCQGVAGGL